MIVLIPAYEPGPALPELVSALAGQQILVVDDGSGPGYAPVFAAARRLGAEVLTLNRNRGKGFALKAGFTHLFEWYPGRDVVCADSDGQHRAADIGRVAARVAGTGGLVLGCRRFTGPVPARSPFGTTVTRAALRLVTRVAVSDTPTGLRAYPPSLLPWLTGIRGERFDYEQSVLLRATREGVPITEVPIATIYLAGNASSHFRPVRDSLRIYRPLLAFAGSSLLAFAVDTVTMLLLAGLTGGLVLPAVAARLLSATVNYTVNRAYVFGRRTTGRRAALRYAALAVALLAVNILLLEGLAMLTGSVPAAKLGTELLLFTGSFLAQRHLVFRPAPPAARPRVTRRAGV